MLSRWWDKAVSRMASYLYQANNIVTAIIITTSALCKGRPDPRQLHQLLSSDAGPSCTVVAATSRDAIGCHSQRMLLETEDPRLTYRAAVSSIPTCIAA